MNLKENDWFSKLKMKYSLRDNKVLFQLANMFGIYTIDKNVFNFLCSYV